MTTLGSLHENNKIVLDFVAPGVLLARKYCLKENLAQEFSRRRKFDYEKMVRANNVLLSLDSERLNQRHVCSGTREIDFFWR